MQAVKLVGSAPAIVVLQEEITHAARSSAKVLITGESGAGKEIVARLIHAGSVRRALPMVTVNCAALTDTLLEAELFGHVRGSFTGAYRDRPGAFAQAHRGTVFMDEIGEMTPRMQGLLLRFLQSGEIQRVGADGLTTIVDVRVIAATNRVLLEAVAQKQFREDLYYRLNVLHLYVPPLRERRGDIPELLAHFLNEMSNQYQTPIPTISDEAIAMLTAYTWPGNVRELRNVVERLVFRAEGGTIDAAQLPTEVLRSPAAAVAATVVTPAPSYVNELFDRMVTGRESFWSVVYAPFMSRDLPRADVRALVERGLEVTAGNYKVMVELFNMRPEDYKRFLGFLRKYHCHMPFRHFRSAATKRGVSYPGGAESGPVDDPDSPA